jgi:hypothetical protein
MVANDTQARYGTSNQPARGRAELNAAVVAATASQRAITSMSAPSRSWSTKKIHDQPKFNINWTAKRPIPAWRAIRSRSERTTSASAMPIIAYSVVQTGPKTQSGGFQLGRSIVRYHEPIPSRLARPPIKPTAIGMVAMATSEIRMVRDSPCRWPGTEPCFDGVIDMRFAWAGDVSLWLAAQCRCNCATPVGLAPRPVVIGGTLLTGGSGSTFGTLAGVSAAGRQRRLADIAVVLIQRYLSREQRLWIR